MKDIKLIAGTLILLSLFIFTVHGCTASLEQTLIEQHNNKLKEKDSFMSQCEEDHKKYECVIMWKSANN